MLNDVTMIGFVAGKTWRVRGDLYFRFASYRDPQRPLKKEVDSKGNREEPDYVTCCLPLSTFTVPPQITSGMLLRLSGYLVSEYYYESLAKFLKNAQGPVSSLSISEAHQRDVLVQRVSNTFTVERFNLEVENVSVPYGHRNGGQPQSNNGQRPAPVAASATPSGNGQSAMPAAKKKKKKKKNRSANADASSVSVPSAAAPIAAAPIVPLAVAADQS